LFIIQNPKKESKEYISKHSKKDPSNLTSIDNIKNKMIYAILIIISIPFDINS
jgi:hypothetical protein